METNTPSVTVPAGMREVTQQEFFAALNKDKRDIMPTTEAREYTPWKIVATREMWGWCSKGWASQYGTPEIYALRMAA